MSIHFVSVFGQRLLLGSLLTFATIFVGCTPQATPQVNSQGATSTESPVKEATVAAESSDPLAISKEDSEHEHKPGEHGGIMVSLGRDSYHVEAVIESDGTVRLYTLGKDESRVMEVDSQILKGFAKSEDEPTAVAVNFDPQPQEGDSPNRTSQFTGKLPSPLVGKSVVVTIPNIVIQGERFRLGFQSQIGSHSATESAMPDKVGDDAERDLYLTPGGRYTAADIVANGSVTATEKFRGVKSAHDMSPKSGDKICPITKTKANPKFTWIVDGNAYEFCCPPCVDEFLKKAKESDEPLPLPQDFVKQ